MINMNLIKVPSSTTDSNSVQRGNIQEISLPDDILTIKYDKYSVTLPRDKSEKVRVGKFLKTMINLELGLKSEE